MFVGDLWRGWGGEGVGSPDCGKQSLNAIEAVLEGHGLGLGMRLENWPPPSLRPEHELEI